MANLNKVMLIGNVTRDPEIKYTPKGSAVTDLGIAVNRVYTPEGGERREETTFVDITLWGRQAEIAGEYCKKGRSIYIEGRLQLDTWEDKTSGQKRSKLRVVGENFQLLGPDPVVPEVIPERAARTCTMPRPGASRVVDPGLRLPSRRSRKTTFLFESSGADANRSASQAGPRGGWADAMEMDRFGPSARAPRLCQNIQPREGWQNGWLTG